MAESLNIQNTNDKLYKNKNFIGIYKDDLFCYMDFYDNFNKNPKVNFLKISSRI